MLQKSQQSEQWRKQFTGSGTLLIRQPVQKEENLISFLHDFKAVFGHFVGAKHLEVKIIGFVDIFAVTETKLLR